MHKMMSSQGGDVVVPRVINVGSRRSRLAMIQTEFVIDQLRKHHPNTEFVIKSLDTIGDNVLNKPLSKIGEKSLFTRELEDELLQGNVDIVVHSLKDLPTKLPDNCCIGAITCREDPTDSIVYRAGYQPPSPAGASPLTSLKDAVFGTSSLRRISQLKANLPEVRVKDVRGNINTRLAKLDDHQQHGYDCLVLATAGLLRSNLGDRISHRLEWYHAVSQGALGIETRTADRAVIEHLLGPIRDERTTLVCLAERAFLCHLEGGCSVPIGVLSELSDDGKWLLTLKGIVLSLDGQQQFESSRAAALDATPTNVPDQVSSLVERHFTDINVSVGFRPPFQTRARNSVALGIQLAQDLIALGAEQVLRSKA